MNVIFLLIQKLYRQGRVGLLVLCLGIFSLGMTIMPSYATSGIFAKTATQNSNNTAQQTDQDSFGRDTPRSTVQRFLHALATDPQLTLEYLDSGFVKNIKEKDKQDFVANLQHALDIGGRIDPTLNISDKTEGDLADMLPSNEEKVGSIELVGKSIDLLLVKKMSKDNVVYWQISPKTLDAIPTNLKETPTGLSDRLGFQNLKGTYLFGQDLADIASLLVLIALGLLSMWLLVWLLYWLVALTYPRLTKRRFAIPQKVILPLAVVILAQMLPEIMLGAGVPLILRSWVIQVQDVVAYLAMTWLVLRLIDGVFKRAEALSLRKNRPEQVSLLNLSRKIAKAVMLVMALILVLGNLGFDLTTGIAALGIGGLALAFGAQKTIENLIGSVVVVADRPVHVGDFCRFGTMEGTVIDIGIRSSRIRTLNRTIVTVPNGEFSSMQIENYTARDMFHFLHNLYLQRDVSPQELNRLITGLKAFLLTHPNTNHEWTQVRISELRQDCFVVEIRCYIPADDVRMFYDKQTELVIDVLTHLQTYQIKHALPSQNVYLKDNLQDNT